ncbi:MAG: hypothetical protein EAZ20_01630, partial [Bacteroidetes bacterium]
IFWFFFFTFIKLMALRKEESFFFYPLSKFSLLLFDLFIQAPGTNLFDFEPYDANIKFVVLLTGAKRIVSGKVKSKLEENVKPHWKEHILVVKGKSLESFPDLALGTNKEERKLPYFYLLDKNGKIVYHTSGKYSKQKQQEIDGHLQEMLGDNQFDKSKKEKPKDDKKDDKKEDKKGKKK